MLGQLCILQRGKGESDIMAKPRCKHYATVFMEAHGITGTAIYTHAACRISGTLVHSGDCKDCELYESPLQLLQPEYYPPKPTAKQIAELGKFVGGGEIA